MGKAIAELGWPRHTYVISTKFYWGIHDSPNMRNTLNRKYLLQAIDEGRAPLDEPAARRLARDGPGSSAADLHYDS